MNSKSTRPFQFVFSVLIYLMIFDFNYYAQDLNLGTIRAIHMGGNWGTNPIQIPQRPEDYYQFLKRVNVNWAGISVALHIDNSLDDTVEKNYDENLRVPTFRDNPLRDAIKGFRDRNIHVYLTLAIESFEAASSEYPVNRSQLGDPFAFNSDSNIKEENWPWNPPHPDYATFVHTFWESYASEAKYFAKIAEEEGVELFSLGTETDRLFRTRSGGPFPNNFLDELTAVVDSVRSVFSGMVTYDMHYGVLEDTPVFSAGSDYLFQDLGLDVVGVSAYFQLRDTAPANVVSVDTFKDTWRNIFNNELTPLKDRNPDLPVLFLEFGYVDAPGSPFLANMDEFMNRDFNDNNGNGLDDGEEQQANIFEAFYTVNEEFERLVQGTFLWGNEIASDADWNNSFGQMRTFSIRNKLAEDIVSTWYGLYKPDIDIPQLFFPKNGADDIPINTELKWHSSVNADFYNVRISDKEDFSNNVLNSLALNDTVLTLDDLSHNTIYYWQVTAMTSEGMSEWSEIFSFTTEETEPAILPGTPVLIYPENNAVNITLNTELKWYKTENADLYTVRISDIEDFSNIIFDSPALSDTVFTIEDLLNSTTYYWQVNAMNSDGMSGWSETFSFATISATSINEKKNIPYEFKLSQNYPNPFNPATLIKFIIPLSNYDNGGAGVGLVTLKVYDILGNEITTLVNKILPAGIYKVTFNGGNLTSGIYIYQLIHGRLVSSRKMVFLK